MSSPAHGVYAFGEFEAVPDYVANVYPLPTTGSWPASTPIRVLSAQYHVIGVDQWRTLNGVTYQPAERTVRVVGATPDATQLRFVLSFPFIQATTLEQDSSVLGLSSWNEDVPCLGAAGMLALADEGRRVQPVTQGDPRRATEVQPGANIGVSRSFFAQFNDRLLEEHARLVGQYPYRQQFAVQQ
jgi:hypothetical protein